MIKVSELLSKRLIALSTAEEIGTISNIIFDSKLTSGKILKVYTDDDSDVTTKYVELKKVKNLCNDAAVIADKSSVTAVWNTTLNDCIVNPINSECYNQDGKALGNVTDIVLDGVKVESVLVGSAEFSPKNLLSFSDKILIFNDTGKPIKISKPKVSVPKTANPDLVAVIHSDNINNQNANIGSLDANAANIADSKNTGVKIPSKVPVKNTVVSRSPAENEGASALYNFLVGKTLSKEIRNDNNEIILNAYTTVTEESIMIAKQHGKLVQLALHAE